MGAPHRAQVTSTVGVIGDRTRADGAREVHERRANRVAPNQTPMHSHSISAPRAIASMVAAVGLLGLSLLLFGSPTSGQRAGPDPLSVEWVCKYTPARVQLLFDSLSLDRPGLETVKLAVTRNDYPTACSALIDYYRNARTAAWIRRASIADTGAIDRDAEPILGDTMSFYNATAKLPRRASGGVDWLYNGPQHDPEWGWSLNDLYYFGTLIHGYLKTGRRAYVERVDADVRDWILSNPMPHGLTRTGPWRGIEVATRAQSWMNAFYRLQDCDAFSPAARILMLSSLVEHASYLQLFHRREAGNWAVTELDGLGTIGAAWPEFAAAPGWRKYALEKMGRQMRDQVYPDGSMLELTVHYHRIATEHFDRFVQTFQEFGIPVPDSLIAGVHGMWNYLAYTTRPDGTSPENNDSDRRDMREKLVGAAREHGHPEWAYIASNGAQGTAPAAGPSVVFPWAGQAIMRSGWDAQAQWSFFDLGPSGTAHQHRDKLHLSIDAFGRPLLVDAGRLNYKRNDWRDYFTGSSSHNVLLIDGRGQNGDCERATAPLSKNDYATGAAYDFARGVFDAGFDHVRGQAIHTRVVIYVHNEFWVVADRIETDRPRTVEALWHFAPDCHVRIDGKTIVTDDEGKANLRIAPVGGVRWMPAIEQGVETPEIQGWYSGYYNEKVPAPAAIFSAEIPGTTTFAWVLLPARGTAPAVDSRVISSRAERIELRIQTRPENWFIVTIPMNAWKPTVRREG